PAAGRLVRGDDAVYGGQPLVVSQGEAPAVRQDAVQPSHLDQPDRRLHVRHAVVEAELRVLLQLERSGLVPRQVRGGGSVRAEAAEPGRGITVGGRDHAALTGGDALAGVEAEACE